MLALIFPVLLACSVALAAGAGWLLVAFNIVLVPALDHAVRRLRPGWQPSAALRGFCFAQAWFWIYALAQAAALVWALHVATREPTGVLALMGLASGIGIMSGTGGITAAHELVHRRGRADRALGLVLLSMASYLHFRIQHVEGHHRHVGTARDPVSAGEGEHFPAFFMRVLWQGPLQAWRIERSRRLLLELAVWAPGNRMLQYAAIQLAVYAAVSAVFGMLGVVLFALQSLIAIHLLEAVNFVQHYGLRRDEHERVSEHHAWEADDPLSPLLIFNLSRHAVHHRRPGLRLDRLPPSANAPRLPFSFFLMVFLALIPPLWERVMRPRLRALAAASATDHERKPPSTASVVPVT